MVKKAEKRNVITLTAQLKVMTPTKAEVQTKVAAPRHEGGVKRLYCARQHYLRLVVRGWCPVTHEDDVKVLPQSGAEFASKIMCACRKSVHCVGSVKVRTYGDKVFATVTSCTFFFTV